MSKFGRRRGDDGKFAVKHSAKYLAFLWICTLLSVGLLLLAGNAVTDTMASFQSCGSNSSGLEIHNCGKQALNLGDIMIFGLFALAAALTVSLFTASWRATRGRE